MIGEAFVHPAVRVWGKNAGPRIVCSLLMAAAVVYRPFLLCMSNVCGFRHIAVDGGVAGMGPLVRVPVRTPYARCPHFFAKASKTKSGLADREFDLTRLRVVLRATDPNFAANVGQAIDVVREDHGQLPGLAPGLRVADPAITLELAQLPALRFEGLQQYQQFWGNFRTGVELVSSTSRSEVLQLVQSGLYVRLRWRLVLEPRASLGGDAAAGALRVARNSLDQAVAGGLAGTPGLGNQLGGWLQKAGDGLLGEAEQWASTMPRQLQEDRIIELNSIYELDCWNGRVVRHTLEFRSPEEDMQILGAMQGVPSYR